MESYIQTDQLFHLLSQTIAKANRTYVPKEEDDSHTNLYFDVLGNQILGRWFSTVHRKFLLSLKIEDLTFELIDETLNSVKRIYIVGKNIEQVNDDVGQAIQSQGFDIDAYQKPMHYEIPAYGIGRKRISLPDKEGFTSWKKYRSLANEAIGMFAACFSIAPEARIWPHHFDTGMYSQASEKMGLGFGLAMKDDMIGEPYFYLAGYPSSGPIEFSDLPENKGEWVLKENWKGAVLRLSEFTDDLNANRKLINEFIIKTVNWYLKQ